MAGRGQAMEDLLAASAPAPPGSVPIPARSVAPAPPPAAETEATPAPGRSRPPARTRPKPVTSEVTESQAPLWQRLERKELRLRADQLDELARIRRALNRQRGGAGERITDNTLIRVAVDMLLGKAGKLRGVTEDELRKSVTS